MDNIDPANAERVTALIGKIHEAERELQELIGGAIDSVVDTTGKPFLLASAQENLRAVSERQREAVKMQTAILDALPANIALVDRAVLARDLDRFSYDYPCHSPAEQRWFRLMVTPLDENPDSGAVVMHIDITERIVAENIAREKEALLRIGSRAAKLGGWSVELTDPPVIRWSDETAEIHGAPPGHMPDLESAIRYYDPEDREVIRSVFIACAGSGEPFDVEASIIAADGTRKWVRSIGEAVRDMDGRIVRVEGAFQDLSEVIAMRESLAASESRFRELAESMPMIVWTATPGGEVDYSSERFSELTGIPRDESAATRWHGALHPDDLPRCLDEWGRCVESQTPFNIEYRIFSRIDGDFRWFNVQAVPIFDGNGQCTKWYGTAIDIHDVKRLQEEAVSLAGRLRHFAEATNDAIRDWDMVEDTIWWSNGYARLIGYSPDDLSPKSDFWLSCIHSDDRDGVISKLNATLEGDDETWEDEYRMIRKDGSTASVFDRGWVFRDDDGRATRMIGGMSDLTERRKLERQILRAQRMESIGTLAGGIAHDLNNVLAPIMMSIEMLKMHASSDEAKNILTTIEQSARRGADLVKQVLAFGRGVDGERIIVNPLHVFNDLLNVMKETFPKSIDVRFETPGDLWPITGDPTQIHQVFLNLFVNARDAMPQGGKLGITLENVVIDETYSAMNPDSHPGSYVCATVVDSGTGIHPDVRERIFDPFFTTKELGHGTGLGLSTTLAIIRSHGGFINLYSEIGKGTRFKVYFPAETTRQAADETALEQTRLPRGNGELILVVDDEESIRIIVKNTLERFGYRVMLASHGAEAVAAYAIHKPEIAAVITDMAMPIMDGPALILALRAMNPDVNIIGSSGLASSDGLAKAVGAGVAVFISKPYTAGAMLKALRDTLAAH